MEVIKIYAYQKFTGKIALRFRVDLLGVLCGTDFRSAVHSSLFTVRAWLAGGLTLKIQAQAAQAASVSEHQ
jgi:hypothetical protein